MNKQDIIDQAMDFLDFEKIHKTMLYLNWTWHNTGVPEIYEIRQFVRKLINELIDKNLREIQCGGFHIYKRDKDIVITFELTYLEIYEDENLGR